MKTKGQSFRFLLWLIAALGWCGFLIVIRAIQNKTPEYCFLFLNLGLAVIPLGFSTLATVTQRRPLQIAFGCLWLLFLPNAPYIITDFVHLRALDSDPVWLDVLMLTSCAGTGLALGYSSVLQVHRKLDSLGHCRLGWWVAISSLFLCGSGIYLGRFLRWNSIDIARNPVLLLADIAEPFSSPILHSKAWAVTLGFGTMLNLGYFLLVLWSRPSANPAFDSTPFPAPDSNEGRRTKSR